MTTQLPRAQHHPAQGRSATLREGLRRVIPGGAHTYAKGDDQYPEFLAPVVARGSGCHVWDVDGNAYIEYGMGLRAVTLGHADERVLGPVRDQMRDGCNFTRPTELEYQAATEFLELISTAEMVKFTKNGSDATTAAIRLARAATGRDLVALCADQPFFSVDDWFIGTTPMAAGIPRAIADLTLRFHYNDLASVRDLFGKYPGQIACVILEPVSAGMEPEPGFLGQLRNLCSAAGAVLIFDEMISGFRYHLRGAQSEFRVTPDLSTFGKALGNGFAISALAGRRELMDLGGFPEQHERVFLLSTTHGAEGHALAASRAVNFIYRSEDIIGTLYRQGQRLADGVRAAAHDRGLDEHFTLHGRPCNLVYATRDTTGARSQPFRTLFLQELLRRGVLAPSFVVSAAHTDDAVDQTIEAVAGALDVYAKALHDGIDGYLEGRPVKPAIRAYS